MVAQQKPKPTHAIEEPLPPPPHSPVSTSPPNVIQGAVSATSVTATKEGGKVLATPAVRKIAMDHGVRKMILYIPLSHSFSI